MFFYVKQSEQWAHKYISPTLLVFGTACEGKTRKEGPGKLNGVSSQLIRKDSAGLIDHFVGERRCGGDRPRPPRMQDGWKKDDGEGREGGTQGTIHK